MIRRRGGTAPASKKQRGAPSSSDGNDEDGNNCPVCYEPFDTGRGERTIVHPFSCNGGDGIRHAICKTCDKRMFAAHGDKCPICRAARLGSSIRQLGWRPAREMDTTVSMFGPTLTSGGTIFFPVELDVEEVPSFEVRRVNASAAENVGESASSIVSDVMADPSIQAAIEGLRNPGRITVAAFLLNMRQARRARN